MNVFSPMDSWIAAAGRADDWLALGLDLLDGWQAVEDDETGAGQPHLVAVLAALRTVRPVTPVAPDPLVLAVWVHHASEPRHAQLSGPAVLALSATSAYDRLADLGGPGLAREVARLVLQFGVRHPDPDDVSGGLLHAAHLAAVSPTHLAAVPPVPQPSRDQ